MTEVEAESDGESLVADCVVQTHSVVFFSLSESDVIGFIVCRKTCGRVHDSHAVIWAGFVFHRVDFIINPCGERLSDLRLQLRSLCETVDLVLLNVIPKFLDLVVVL